jgi:hypothetical protein
LGAVRLASQLKAAVEQLDIMILAFEDAALKIEASNWPIVEARRKIADSFATIVAAGRLPEVMAPKDWSRFAENVLDLVQALAGGVGRRQPVAMAQAAIDAVERELVVLGQSAT